MMASLEDLRGETTADLNNKEIKEFHQKMERFYNEGWFKDVCLLCGGNLRKEGEIEEYLQQYAEHEGKEPEYSVMYAFLAAQMSEALLINNPELRHKVQKIANEQSRLYPDAMNNVFHCFARFIFFPEIFIEPYCDDLDNKIDFCDKNDFVKKLMFTFTMRRLFDSDFVKTSGITMDMIVKAEKKLIEYDLLGFYRQYKRHARIIPWYMENYFEAINQPI